jgi:hypothetical protein
VLDFDVQASVSPRSTATPVTAKFRGINDSRKYLDATRMITDSDRGENGNVDKKCALAKVSSPLPC